AVGVSFALLQVEIFSASGIIALTTLLLSLAASFLGKGFGSLLKSKAEVFGGVILILIGVKSLLEYKMLDYANLYLSMYKKSLRQIGAGIFYTLFLCLRF